MCAIHGFLWPDPVAMSKMVDLSRHRGPDGQGQWNDQDITLGHNLLSIVDDAAPSAQPWIHNDYILVYNGEIYNYKELRKTLNYQCKTNTDTEVLVAGIEQYGKSFIHRLDGMFAFACYNTKTKQLILARDSNGAKPFYYGEINGRLAFSSEIKSLLSLGFDRKVSIDGFKHYYHSGLATGYLTCFENIYRLLPGEIVELNIRSKHKVSTNINNDAIAPYTGNAKELQELLPHHLRQAVDLTFMGRREVGIFLSGGMDSSSVFYEAVSGLGRKPLAASTRFDAPSHSTKINEDADLAHKLCEQFAVTHKELLFTEQDWVDYIERTMLSLEEPRQGRSFPAYYLTNKLLNDNGVIVTLSGDGGDELLVGYKHYANPPYENKLKKFRSVMRTLSNPKLQLEYQDQIDYLYSWVPKGMLTDDVVNNSLYIDSLNSLSEDFLIRNDKLGMAFGMEARFPLMCNEFKNFARSIPSKMKVEAGFFDGQWSKYSKGLFKNAYQNKLPSYILNKAKSGWRAPTDEWLIGLPDAPAKDGGPMKQYIRSLVTPDIMEIFDIRAQDLDKKYLNNKDHTSVDKPGKAGIGLLSQKELFTVVMFAVWYKQFGMSM